MAVAALAGSRAGMLLALVAGTCSPIVKLSLRNVGMRGRGMDLAAAAG